MKTSLSSGLIFCFLTSGGWLFAAPPQPHQITQKQQDVFETKVRPVLVEHCFSCHGSDRQEAGLRLDSREAMLKGSENGPVVTAGDAATSALVQAITYTGDVQMPPKGMLPASSINAIRQWIRMELPWPADTGQTRHVATDNHWSLQPIRDPDVPQNVEDDWSQTSVDRLVFARLRENGLRPSRPANRRTLIRRATFDLIGLPPSPEEIDAFVSDSSPRAFAKVVDRLPKSPHYGERWGRHWLDVARYADSGNRWAYANRDYVVRAFNEDLPFDRFVLEQLAADQLELGEDKRPLAAMGFLTGGNRFFAEFDALHDIIDDRIDVVTRGLLGLTVSCARCHDHKYDPITQADYYALYGIFRSSGEPLVPPLLARPQLSNEYKDFAVELHKRRKKLIEFVDRTHAELVSTARRRTAEHLIAAYNQRDHPETGAFLLLQSSREELQPVVLRRWRVYLRRTRDDNHPVWRPWHAFAELSEDAFAKKSRDVMAGLRKERPGSTNRLVLNAFAKPPRSMAEVAKIYAKVLNQIDQRWQDAQSRSADSGEPGLTRLAGDAEEQLRQVFRGVDAPPNLPKSIGPRFTFVLRYEPTQIEFIELLNSVREWINDGPGAPARATVLVDRKVLHEPRVFIRGNPARLGDAVSRRFLSVLGGSRFSEGSGRLELAREIVDPSNPLTPRVIVNRIWMHHFGQGLVRTPSDFGARGDLPSHPDLLDHLASTFMRDGWSIKKLHRRIMLSSAYQQQSDDRDECLQVDPENRLLWKMNRRRLDFEAMRDSLLAVSGALDPTVGGPPDEELALQLAHLDGQAEQFEEAEELIGEELQERIAQLKRELRQARADDNQVEVEEITELLERLRSRSVGGDDAGKQRRIEQLHRELKEARQADNDAEVREIEELLRNLGAQPESEDGSGQQNASEPRKFRRTIYGFIERGNLPELFRAFDFPSPVATSAQRDQTTVPPQALFLMNHPFVRHCARGLAERRDVAALPTVEDRLTRIHQLLYGRSPTEDELAIAKQFLGEDATVDLWTSFVHAMLMTNEFAFVD